jgi:hypothetical protein
MISKSLSKEEESAEYGDEEEPAAYGDEEESAEYGDEDGAVSGIAMPVNRTRRPLSIPRDAQSPDLFCKVFGR